MKKLIIPILTLALLTVGCQTETKETTETVATTQSNNEGEVDTGVGDNGIALRIKPCF